MSPYAVFHVPTKLDFLFFYEFRQTLHEFDLVCVAITTFYGSKDLEG